MEVQHLLGDRSFRTVAMQGTDHPRAGTAGKERLELAGCLERRHVANQVEGLLIHVIVVSVCEPSQAGDGGIQLHVLAWAVGEELGYEEGLRQEALNLPSSVHD